MACNRLHYYNDNNYYVRDTVGKVKGTLCIFVFFLNLPDGHSQWWHWYVPLLTMWPVTSHVYKRATESGLPAGTICTQPNWRKHKILYFMEIALSNSYQLLICWKGASSFYFHNSWIYVEIMPQNVNFPILSVQYVTCQNTQSTCIYKVTLIVHKAHMVYR